PTRALIRGSPSWYHSLGERLGSIEARRDDRRSWRARAGRSGAENGMIRPQQVMLAAWAVLCSIWCLLGWRSKRTAESAGNHFMSVHVLLMGSAFVFAFMSRRILPWRLWQDTPTIVWLGAVLTCVGVIFASWSRVYLGSNWSGTPTIKLSHELVRRGPYALA